MLLKLIRLGQVRSGLVKKIIELQNYLTILYELQKINLMKYKFNLHLR